MPLLAVDEDAEVNNVRFRTVVIGVMVAGLVACAGAAIAGAQDGDGGARQARRDAFVARVAEKLGIEPAALTQAVTETRLERVDEALANGRVTEEQAERLRARIEEGKGAGLRDALERRHERRVDARAAVIESAAEAIGISGDELRGELRAGKSVADVAGEHGVAIDDVKEQILGDAAARLARAVENGRITQGQSDAMLEKLSGRLDEALERRRVLD
jgi:hypothetical protein